MESKCSSIDQEAAHILYPPTKDEEVVYSALLDFPNALLAHHPLQNKWSLHRVPLTATFKKVSFQARADGYLQDRKTGKIRALVEVRPYMRDTLLAQIRMQETAQIVAWILSTYEDTVEKPGWRIIVSQDRHEIFPTVAVFDEA
ncbi:hypothetical protein BDV39DRAFT_201001 [Aspergillus sergii]|uniref:Uncharacterized protein n=1 Tax=Aspergillus sergii TaxID=1034303 RepID=A0A5N6XGW0_9EURO|nr:hypothetical protein BDV39DRAFT_201001 [Aspergillus sergii]